VIKGLPNTRRCLICKEVDPFFFTWSTSRYFNRSKVLDIMRKKSHLNKYDVNDILHGEYRVCGHCRHKHNLMVRR
jgi:hypothetical protein